MSFTTILRIVSKGILMGRMQDAVYERASCEKAYSTILVCFETSRVIQKGHRFITSKGGITPGYYRDHSKAGDLKQVVSRKGGGVYLQLNITGRHTFYRQGFGNSHQIPFHLEYPLVTASILYHPNSLYRQHIFSESKRTVSSTPTR